MEELKHCVLESELAMPLNGGGLVEQGERADEVLGLRQEPDMGEDWSVIAAPIVFVAPVLLDYHWAVRVILDQYSISVGHALIVFVNVRVLILLSFVCRHKCDWLLLIARENI